MDRPAPRSSRVLAACVLVPTWRSLLTAVHMRPAASVMRMSDVAQAAPVGPVRLTEQQQQAMKKERQRALKTVLRVALAERAEALSARSEAVALACSRKRTQSWCQSSYHCFAALVA